MKILFIQPPFCENDFWKEEFFAGSNQAPLFPGGIASIASFLRDRSFDNITILDVYAKQMRRSEVTDFLRHEEYDVVGISALVNQYDYVKWLAKEIKAIRNVPIILGNGLGTASDRIVLSHIPQIDFCVRGEGEIPFYELLCRNFSDLEGLKGISYRTENEITRTPDAELISNLDELSFPAYDLVDMEKYLCAKFYETGVFNIRAKYKNVQRVIPILTGRGCPYNCKFCGKVIPRIRMRSIAHIVKELEFMRSKYAIDGVHFMDELFVLNRKRTLELCGELKRMGLIWDCQGRVNLVDKPLLKKMQESGCVAIGFGIESGSQKILDAMNKKTTVFQIREAMNAAREVGLPVKSQLIFGYPGENLDTINETVNLMKEVRDPGRRFLPICPIPGTACYDYALERGMIEDEEKFLSKITEAFDSRKPAVNFTNFKTEEILDLMRHYYNKMVFNHMLYLLSRPTLFIRKLLCFPKGVFEMGARSILFLVRGNPAALASTLSSKLGQQD